VENVYQEILFSNNRDSNPGFSKTKRKCWSLT